MTTAERARAVGIDPDDPKYHNPHPDTTGPWCEWCHRHKADRLLCDIQQAEAEQVKASGKPHEPCFRCREPRMEAKGLLCDGCQEAIENIATPTRFLSGNGKRRMYRPDGAGCVERVHSTEVAWESRVMGGIPEGWFE